MRHPREAGWKVVLARPLGGVVGAGPGLSPSFRSVPCRLGRWWRIKEARNSVCIIPLHRTPRPPAAGS